MAQSLSSPLHSYQRSPTAESQRHGFNSSNNNSYRQHHQNEVSKDKAQHDKLNFKLSALKGKSWNSFFDSVGCESSEDETEVDTADDDPLITTTGKRQHKNGPIVRLKKRDMALYGHCPQTDQFSVVVCRMCRMVLKPNCLKSHIDRKHHDKERKHELCEAVVKIEKFSSSVERTIFEKTTVVTDKFDKIAVDSKIPSSAPSFFSGVAAEKNEKLAEQKRHRHFQRKSATPSENSNDAVHLEASVPTVTATTESSSASNSSSSPQSRRRKRKYDESTETFHNNAAPAPCHIIEEIVIRDASSPPPLAPITNEPSVWIVTPSPVIIDGSFVVKSLEQETESEIDLKDLKVLKPLTKETVNETSTLLTPSNWYSTQPRPLAVNTFNLRKLNAQRYVMATQRKLIELGRNLRTEEKVVGGKAPPKTWSFIERGVSFIPFRVTH